MPRKKEGAKEVAKEESHVFLQGKWYEKVASRVQKFRSNDKFEGHGLETRVIENDRARGFVVVQATIKTKEGHILGQGLAEEDRTKGHVNKTSALENCETSAIGRALASIGLAGSEYASANEVENAIHQRETPANNDLKEPAKVVPEPPSLKSVVYGLFLDLVEGGHNKEFLFQLVGINDWADLKKRKNREEILIKAKETLEKIKDGKDQNAGT